MTSIDFRTPAAGFDQPLELWLACHDRVRRMCSLMQRLLEHVRDCGADEQAKVTAVSIRRYFDEAAPRHHEDEEIDLFPRLLQRLEGRTGSEAAGVRNAIALLESDHREMGRLWSILREALNAIERGDAGALDEAVVALFVTRYRSHCEIEDTVIAPALRRALSAQELEAVGQAMAQRRGIDWNDIAARHDAGPR
ncbi:MAG: hemerythrin domain-containing protein [Burkholderiaceae bacterium]